MIIKKIAFILVVLYMSNASTAFSETEGKELIKINESSRLELSSKSLELKKIISNAISDSPDKKEYILDLDEKWRGLIESKCNYETVESKGTDAEIASRNQCIVKGYLEEMEYFTHLLP